MTVEKISEFQYACNREIKTAIGRNGYLVSIEIGTKNNIIYPITCILGKGDSLSVICKYFLPAHWLP